MQRYFNKNVLNLPRPAAEYPVFYKKQLDLAILIGEPSGKPRLRKHGQRRALAFQLLDGRYGAESPSEASTKLSWSLAPHTTGNLPRLIDRENSKQMHGITIPPGYENILCP